MLQNYSLTFQLPYVTCSDVFSFVVYRMGRLCGGAHEISGIKAPFFLRGGWLEGSWGGLCGGWVVVLWVPMMPPIMGGASDTPMLSFDNLVKKLDQIVKK